MDDDSWTGTQDGLCISLVFGIDPADTARALCPPDLLAFPSALAASAWVMNSASFDRTWLAAGKIDDWTFVWEDNGFQGADLDRGKSLGQYHVRQHVLERQLPHVLHPG